MDEQIAKTIEDEEMEEAVFQVVNIVYSLLFYYDLQVREQKNFPVRVFKLYCLNIFPLPNYANSQRVLGNDILIEQRIF